jgi:hypothetical protein
MGLVFLQCKTNSENGSFKRNIQVESLASGEKSVNAIFTACSIASGTVLSPEILLRKP